MCTGPVHYCSALGTHLIMGHTIILWPKENPELLTPIVKFAINPLLFSSQLMHTENVSLRKKKNPKTYLSVIHSETEPLQSVFLYREPGWTVSSCPIAECSGHWPSRSEEWTRGQELDWGTTSDCSTALEDLHSTDTETDEVWAEIETVRANSRCATQMWLCFHQGAQAAFKLFRVREFLISINIKYFKLNIK